MAYMVTKSRSRCGGWDGSTMAEQTQIRSDHEKLRTRVVSQGYHQIVLYKEWYKSYVHNQLFGKSNGALWMYLAALSAVDH